MGPFWPLEWEALSRDLRASSCAVGNTFRVIVLETDRLLFRYHEERDRQASYELDAEPRFRHPFEPLELEKARRSFESFLQRRPMMLLATVFKAEDRYIGRCGLYPYLDERDIVVPNTGALALYLHPNYWAMGLGTEAAKAFVAYGFETLGLERIVAGASSKNLASNRVLEKAGLHLVRSGGEGDDGAPAWHDYEILRADAPPSAP
jgi:[ribosomal protein S5]-alanine N-acetyltransferase